MMKVTMKTGRASGTAGLDGVTSRGLFRKIDEVDCLLALAEAPPLPPPLPTQPLRWRGPSNHMVSNLEPLSSITWVE